MELSKFYRCLSKATKQLNAFLKVKERGHGRSDLVLCPYKELFGRKERTKNEDRKQNVIEIKMCKSKRKENKEKRKNPSPRT